MRREGEETGRRALLCCGLLFVTLGLAIWVYWPGQAGGLVLDDKASLLPLATARTSGESFIDAVGAERSGPLGRPLSMATFVLEEFYLGGGAAMIKRHNMLLHALNGVLVYWLAVLLLSWKDYPRATFLALGATALWLLSPLQVSTVLYAVQRMAMLSTTFVLLGLISYLKLRLASGSLLPRIAWGCACLTSVAAAPFAKENGILLLPLIVLLEAVWLAGEGPRGTARPRLAAAAWLGLCGLLALGLAFVALDYGDLESSYRNRGFTLPQRLMTEPLVLWDYARQFFWPDVARLGVMHDDVPVVRSLGANRAALAALVAWCALSIFAVAALMVNGWRAPAFLLFFFLGAHSLESTVLPLEIYFEHRNYLPSVALALLPMVALGAVGRRLPAVVPPLLLLLCLPLLVLATRSSAQVLTWSEAALLDMHHVNGHPRSPRANTQLATRLAGLGEFHVARRYSARAFHASGELLAARRERAADFHLRNIALACLAKAPMPAQDLDALGRAHPERPLGSTYTVEVVARLQGEGRCPDFSWDRLADRLESIYLARPSVDRASTGVYTALAVFANGLGRMHNANDYAGLGLAQAPENVMLLLMRLHFATALELSGAAAETMSRLRRLEAAGELTRQESATLALYGDRH